MKFEHYTGNHLIGLHTNENYMNFKLKDDDCHILFSVTRKGNAAYCHLASDKKGLRKLKQAISDFCDFVFLIFDWAKMILATVKIKSLERWLQDLGFILVWVHPKNIYRVWIKKKG